MGTHDDRYFLLSGLISITFFIILWIVVFYTYNLTPMIAKHALHHSDILNVSLVIEENQDTQIDNFEPAIEDTSLHSVEEKPLITDTSIPDKIDTKSKHQISDLFSKVNNNKAESKSAIDIERIKKLEALEQEVSVTEKESRLSDKVHHLSLVKPSVKISSGSISEGPLVNEYHAKIQSIITTYWHPSKGMIGNQAIINIRLSPTGKLIGYKVIRYSNSGLFNTEVDRFENDLSRISFPAHPMSREANINLDLMAI